MEMDAEDTIAALATPRGKSALAVIRLSGTQAFSVVQRCVGNRKRFADCPPRTVGLYSFVHPQKQTVIDQVTAVKYKGPRSFTGEDAVEITCHGGHIILDRVVQSLLESGARYAKNGEFTRRAFVNGKMSLLRAEAINALVQSRTEIQHENAIRSYLGEYDHVLDDTMEELQNILMEVEAGIEFGDEDSVRERVDGGGFRRKCCELSRFLRAELQKRKRIAAVEKGLQVAIIGEPNVGKSSLFNIVLQYERSLVHSRGGTTRDFVSEDVYIDDMHITLTDTAGIRGTDDDVEKMGVRRSWDHVERAHVVIWVTSAETEVSEEERSILRGRRDKKLIAIVNKMDLSEGLDKRRFCAHKGIPFLPVCMLDSDAQEKLIAFVAEHVREVYDVLFEQCILQNKRQEATLQRIVGEIEDMEKEGNLGEEIVAFYLKNIIGLMEEFVGTTTSENILDRVFGEFCVGK